MKEWFEDMLEEFSEVAKFVCCFLGLFFIFVSLVVFIGYTIDSSVCNQKGEIYGIDTEYHISGCYAVLPDGKMLIRHYEEQTQRTQNIYLVK